MKRKETRTLHGLLTLMLMLGLMLIPGLLPETACAAGHLTQDENGVYQIDDYDDLKAFAEIVNGGEYDANAELTGEIQCDDKKWVPIGTISNPYTGHFDGNNMIIEGLSNEGRLDVGSADFQGLFGYIGKKSDEEKGEVKDVVQEGGKIIGRSYIGGVAGYLEGGTITNCCNSVEVSGGSAVGGVAGYNIEGGTITSCYNTGAVSGSESSQYVGGVAGRNEGTITNCYNTGAVTGSDSNNNVGGVAGENRTGEITSCYNTGAVIGSGDYAGGVAGRNDEKITNCYSSGAVSGSSKYVGGVAGYSQTLEVSNCYYDTTFSKDLTAIGLEEDTGSVKGLTTSEMTGDSAIGTASMNFQYPEGEESPWLVKANGVDEASGEYYEYYPHLKGFNLDSDGGQMDADKIAPADWPAKPHVHKVGDEKVYFMPWEKTDQLPDKAGSYCLTGDVTLDSTWKPSGTVNLCLNDHSITYTGTSDSSVIRINAEGAALDLYDCGDTTRYYYLEVNNKYYYGRGYVVASETDDNYANAGDGQKGTFKGGFITGGQAHSGGGVFVDGPGRSFTMNGGTIIGNRASNGGGVEVDDDSDFTMNGGIITGNQADYNGGGVCHYMGTFRLSGAPVIIGNKAGESGAAAEDVCLADGKTITITDKLQLPVGASEPQIGITMKKAGVFTSGYSDKNPGEIPDKYFVSNDSGYAVYFDENMKEALLAEPAVVPTITKQPEGLDLTYGYTTGDTLKVEASAAEGHTLSYQWYSCNAQGGEETAIDTAKEPSAATEEYMIPEGKEAGDYHYFCRVTAARTNGKTATADSDVATVTITKPQPKPEPQPQTETDKVAPKAMTAGKNALTIHWRKVSGAQGYDIFFSICGKDTKCKLTKTIKGNKTFSWTKSGLKTKTPYKAYVKGWTMKDGKKKYISTSPTLHLYTANGTNNYTVAKSIKVKKTKVKLKVGKKYKIKAKIIKRDKTKKLMPATHTKQLRYISTNKKIATVSKSGKIKAKAKGSCQIYVYAANGVSKAVKVTVR